MSKQPVTSAPLLFDERQAAKMLAISPRTLWSLRDAGEVSCVRIGRAVRYAYDELERWIERKKELPQPNNN